MSAGLNLVWNVGVGSRTTVHGQRGDVLRAADALWLYERLS